MKLSWPARLFARPIAPTSANQLKHSLAVSANNENADTPSLTFNATPQSLLAGKFCRAHSGLPMTLPRFETLRVLLLLSCLAIVGFVNAHQRIYTRNWNQTLEALVYPINGDAHLATDRYIQALDDDDFSIINRWAEREAKRYQLPLPIPFHVTLGETITALPPVYPEQANAMDVLLWSLRFRFWAWRHTPDAGGLTRIRLFVVYQTGEGATPLQHSLGMQKGLMGLVYAYSLDKQTAQNNIVIAHELLHTVGAVDKYNASGSPMMSVGYANPHRSPLYPQRNAEIMAGRIPTGPGRSYMAESLRSVIVNPYTAGEINWID